MASRRAGYEWPSLEEARQQAAERGAKSIGTRHVLFALLDGPDEDAVAALRAGGVDPETAAGALESIAGIGSRQDSVEVESVPVSERVERILEAAAAYDDLDENGAVRDRDVLRALVTSDDPAVGHLILTIVSAPDQVVAELDRRARRQREDA